MPARSAAQQRLFGAVEGGAKFPLANKLRRSMTAKQVHDFAATKHTNLPDRIKVPKPKANQAAARQFMKAPKAAMGRFYGDRHGGRA